MERTFAIIKPDSFSNKFAGKILAVLECKGFKIVGAKLMKVSEAKAKEFYKEHESKPFFMELVEFMTSNPVMVLALERENAVAFLREVVGKTNYKDAEVGTIRRTFATDVCHNAIHASDSLASASRELGLFFANEELLPWETKKYSV